MTRARTFPASASFKAMAGTLATQIADLETSNGGDETDDPLTLIFSTTEKALTRMPVNNVGDLLLKLEILAQIAEDSTVDAEEWQAVARDVVRLNGPGLAFSPEAWLRRWTAKGGGYVRTEAGLSFVAPEPPTFQQRLLMEELKRASGQQAVTAIIDRAGEPEPEEPTINETWEHAKAAYSTAQSTLDQAPSDQSDEACEAEIAAWDAMMMASAPNLEGVRHKFAELFWILHRDHYEPDDQWSERFVAGVIDDIARITREGGAA